MADKQQIIYIPVTLSQLRGKPGINPTDIVGISDANGNLMFKISIQDLVRYSGISFSGNIAGVAKTDTTPIAGATPESQIIYFAGPGTYANFPDAGSAPIVLTENLNIISWDGTKASVQPVPITVDTTGLVNKNSDITIISAPQLFNPSNIETGEITMPEYSLGTNAAYKRTKQIEIEPSTSYDLSGFDTNHYAIPVRFEDESGNLISGKVLIVNGSTSGTFTTPSNVKFLRFTCITPYASDNTILTNISLKKTGAPPDKITKIIGIGLYSELAVNQDQLTFVDNIGKNKFPIGQSRAGYNDPTTFIFTTSALGYRTTPLIRVTPGTFMTISGLGTIHYATGIAFFKEDGVTPCTKKGVLTTASVGEYTFLPPSDCFYITYTWKTAASGDDALEENQQLEVGSVKTDYEAPKSAVSELGVSKDGTIVKMPIISFAPTTPIKANDPISLGYFNLKIGLTTDGKIVFIFGDSITETNTALTNWVTYAMPLLGIKPEDVHNFAKSGAHWEDFSGATVRQKLSEQVADALASGITPDIIIISIGTNSLGSATFGSYEETMAKTYGDLVLTIVMDAQRKLMYDLANAFPDARKFYGTPLQRAAWEIDAMREKVDQYALMARNFNYTIIDAFNESGYLHDFLVEGGASRYSNDGLHPNETFKPILGKFYAKMILKSYFN